jgi:hypothetical protein
VLYYPVNIILPQNHNISLRGLSKSARRCTCALERAWRYFRYKYIDHIIKCEHECTPLILMIFIEQDLITKGYKSSFNHV